MNRLILLPSPLLPARVLHPLAVHLRDERDVVVAEAHAGGETTPEGVVASWSALTGPGCVLIAHSNAGYLAPLLRARHAPGAPIIFMDAALLPDRGRGRPAPPRMLTMLRRNADPLGLLPPWTRWWSREEIGEVIPDDHFAGIDRQCPRLPVSYFETEVEVPHDWQDRANAYLAFGETYADAWQVAGARGWPRLRLDGGHLHFLHDPAVVAEALRELLRQLENRPERP